MFTEYDVKMLDDTVAAVDNVIETYDSSKNVLNDLQVKKTVSQARGVLKDIMSVSTVDAKNSLCRLLDCMLADIFTRVSELEKFVELSSKEIASLHGKIPMPKWKVRKIMKSFGFYDHGVDETNEGNATDIDYKNRKDDELDDLYESCRKADIKDDDCASNAENKDSATYEHIERLHDETSSNDLDDSDLKEEIAPEQFMNVVDDIKHDVDEARKTAEEAGKSSEEDKKDLS